MVRSKSKSTANSTETAPKEDYALFIVRHEDWFIVSY